MLDNAFADKPPGASGKPLGRLKRSCAALLSASMMMSASVPLITPAAAQQAQKPNILFIMGDDIGWMQPSIYHQGLMVGETPNIDRIGNEGAKFMTLLRRAELHGRAYRLHHRHAAGPRRHGPTGTSRQPILYSDRDARRLPNSCSISATTPASSARTIWATMPTRCRPRTASRNSGAICITSMQCRG